MPTPGIGDLYAGGNGVARDHAEANRWYAEAARSGDAKGLFRLGEAYERGNGVAADPVRALMWYRLADEQGYERAAERVQQLSERLDAEQRQQVEAMAAEWRRTNEAR